METAIVLIQIEVPGGCRSQVARDVSNAAAVALAGLVREAHIVRPCPPTTRLQRLLHACGWRSVTHEELS